MSGKNPIPQRLRQDFIAHLSEAQAEADSLSDGAWYMTLDIAAEAFIKKHRLPAWADSDAAVMQYLKLTGQIEKAPT